MKKITSFTLAIQTLEILEKLAEKTGLAKSDIVRRAIEDYNKKVYSESKSLSEE